MADFCISDFQSGLRVLVETGYDVMCFVWLVVTSVKGEINVGFWGFYFS